MRAKLHYMPRCGMGKIYSQQTKYQVVRWALSYGIKPTAQRAKISRNTIRSWLKRYQLEGRKGFEDKRAGPIHKPLKISNSLEKQIVAYRKKAPAFGPIRLKYFFKIPCSTSAIARVLRQHKLTMPRKRKKKKRHDLREYKALKYKGLEHLQVDLKHLTDMPFYVKQMKALNLPKYQYTVRDTKTGMLFLGFSNELSELNARTMAQYVLNSMDDKLKSEKPPTIQTDNGAEFSGLSKCFETSSFSRGIKELGAEHCYIRPGHKNAQADVESSHRLIEEEFYDYTVHHSREDFIKNCESYRLFFNMIRPNYYKKSKTPWLLMHEDYPEENYASKMSLLQTIDLDKNNGHKPYKEKGQSLPCLSACINMFLGLLIDFEVRHVVS